jgi:hypothetical protein
VSGDKRARISNAPPVDISGGEVDGPDWFVWRLVIEQVATLRELDEHWGMADVLDANEALDKWAARQQRRTTEA